MKEKGVTFDKLKARLETEKYEKVDKINALEDIPKVKIFELIERLKKIDSELNTNIDNLKNQILLNKSNEI